MSKQTYAGDTYIRAGDGRDDCRASDGGLVGAHLDLPPFQHVGDGR